MADDQVDGRSLHCGRPGNDSSMAIPLSSRSNISVGVDQKNSREGVSVLAPFRKRLDVAGNASCHILFPLLSKTCTSSGWNATDSASSELDR